MAKKHMRPARAYFYEFTAAGKKYQIIQEKKKNTVSQIILGPDYSESVVDINHDGRFDYWEIEKGNIQIKASQPQWGQFQKVEYIQKQPNGISNIELRYSFVDQKYVVFNKVLKPYQKLYKEESGLMNLMTGRIESLVQEPTECKVNNSPTTPLEELLQNLEKLSTSEYTKVVSKRLDVQKEKLFDPQCWEDSEWSQSMSAILDSLASVLNSSSMSNEIQRKAEKNESPAKEKLTAPRFSFLQCLESNGLGVEATAIRKNINLALETGLNSNGKKLFTCEKEEGSFGSYNQKTSQVTLHMNIKEMSKAPIASNFSELVDLSLSRTELDKRYSNVNAKAQKNMEITLFHELLHSAGLESESLVDEIQTCCGMPESDDSTSCQNMKTHLSALKKKKDTETILTGISSYARITDFIDVVSFDKTQSDSFKSVFQKNYQDQVFIAASEYKRCLSIEKAKSSFLSGFGGSSSLSTIDSPSHSESEMANQSTCLMQAKNEFYTQISLEAQKSCLKIEKRPTDNPKAVCEQVKNLTYQVAQELEPLEPKKIQVSCARRPSQASMPHLTTPSFLEVAFQFLQFQIQTLQAENKEECQPQVQPSQILSVAESQDFKLDNSTETSTVTTMPTFELKRLDPSLLNPTGDTARTGSGMPESVTPVFIVPPQEGTGIGSIENEDSSLDHPIQLGEKFARNDFVRASDRSSRLIDSLSGALSQVSEALIPQAQAQTQTQASNNRTSKVKNTDDSSLGVTQFSKYLTQKKKEIDQKEKKSVEAPVESKSEKVVAKNEKSPSLNVKPTMEPQNHQSLSVADSKINHQPPSTSSSTTPREIASIPNSDYTWWRLKRQIETDPQSILKKQNDLSFHKVLINFQTQLRISPGMSIGAYAPKFTYVYNSDSKKFELQKKP